MSMTAGKWTKQYPYLYGFAFKGSWVLLYSHFHSQPTIGVRGQCYGNECFVLVVYAIFNE